mmetsp:Transcript_67792/g.201693  ORF Transcript_67792/g.201693 Transcript_67792/m.201693 type:complete len:445 (-) Transcript_67792:104-1438(-)
MPVDDTVEKEILADESLLKVCGNSPEVAADSLELLNRALQAGKLSLAERKLADESFMRVIKAIGIIAKAKNLLPRRTSVLPITEVDIGGNTLLTLTPHPLTGAPELSTKSLQPLQLAVQFVRVSTDARVVRLDGCSLQGTSHDKDDKVEQEVIRLVKKFGAGKDARYAREVSLRGNKFEAEFAKKIIEAAYWERARDPDKENPPRLLLDLRRNRIRCPQQMVDELRAGRNAGGSISVATTEDPVGERDKALIVVDLKDQLDRSVTPVRGLREPVVRPPRPSPARQCSGSPAARRQPSPRRQSPPAARQLSPPAVARKRDLPARGSSTPARQPSPRRRGRSASRRACPRTRGQCSASPARGGGRQGGHADRDDAALSQSGASCRSEDSRSRTRSRGIRHRRRHHHHRRHRRRGKRRREPSWSYTDSASPSPRRRGHGRRRRHRRH